MTIVVWHLLFLCYKINFLIKKNEEIEVEEREEFYSRLNFTEEAETKVTSQYHCPVRPLAAIQKTLSSPLSLDMAQIDLYRNRS